MIQFQNEGKEIIEYLIQLTNNNQKDWFDANKNQFSSILKDFKRVVGELSYEICKFDSSIIPTKPEDYIFRIYKDMRFSKEKVPYKTHFAAYICNGGKKSPRAGYYLHIEPNNCFVAGGLYKPSASLLKAFRQEIYYSTKDFLSIVESKDFVQNLDGLMDDKAVKMPKDFPVDHPAAEYLKYKSLIASKNFTNEEVVNPEFFTKVLESFKSLTPLNLFINKAIDLLDNN